MTKPAVPLIIRLFSAPEVKTHGDSLPLTNQKARALLFYLVVTAQPHTRSHLASLLWSEFRTGDARRSLRVTLFHLRHVLQDAGVSQVIVSEGDLLSFPLAGHTCDVTDFLSLMAEGSQPALLQAITLYRGSFLEGFALPNAPLFDEWMRQVSEKLTLAYLGALKRLAGEAEAQQDWTQAIVYLQRLVQTDPLAEEAQQQLIGLYLKTGATGQALRQYQLFETELQEALGLTPAAETQTLFQEGLRQHQLPLFVKTAVPTPSNRRSQSALPFVGRESLLDRLLTVSRTVKRDGRSHTILLQGDGGIGKSRLMHEFLNLLATETPPWLVLSGVCSPFDDLISYGPFLEAFQETALGDLTDRLLVPQTDDPADREQFVYRILQTLRQLSQNTPLVLTIDDLQWANSATLNLFGLLASRLHHLPLLLMGTAQRPEAIPALQRLVTIERRRGELELLSLPPLTETAVTHLLHHLAISHTSVPSLAQWLQARSDGSPFVLDEMLAQLRADAILTPVGDHWSLDPGRWLRWRATFTLPETSHDLVSWRLRHLTEEAHTLLEILAVAGQPLPYALLADIPRLVTGQMLPILDDLLNRRLLVETGDGMFGLSHSLLRETVLQRLSHVRRRLIHRQLAQMLANCPAVKANFPLWEVARHAVAGEDIELSRRYGLQILARLPQDYAGAGTVDFLHHLHDLLAPVALPEEMLQLTRVIGGVHQSLGHLPEAAHWQQQYLAWALQTGNLTAQAAAYLERGEVALVSNDYLAATAAAEAGLAACALLSEADPAHKRLSGRAHRLLGHALAMEGRDLGAAERHLMTATAVHRQADNARDLCASLFELGNVAAQRGNLLSALELYEEAAHVARLGQSHYMHALAHNNYAYHSLLLGWPQVAQRALARGQKLAETYELLGAYLHLSSTQGEIHLYLAEWATAAELFQSGLTLAEEMGNPERQAGYRAGLALAARGQHNLSEAIALLEEALWLINGRGYWHLRTRLLIWLAETLLLAERDDEARRQLAVASETAVLHGRALLQLQAERLQATLLAYGGDWAAAELHFKQTEAQAAALDLPLEMARTQAAWGQAALRFAPIPHQADTLLNLARQVFASHQATAELAALASTPSSPQ